LPQSPAILHVSGAASDLFLRYGRARGTFNDPNVLGAFLVPPALLLLQRVFAGRPRQVLKSSIALLVLAAALLLSFSRGAWAQFGICTVLLTAVTFAGSRSGAERIRIAAIATYGTLILALFIAALLSIESVADLFKERASFEQSYDAGYLGRFGRYSLGFDLALDRPLGIGPLQFGNFFPEDAHNTQYVHVGRLARRLCVPDAHAYNACGRLAPALRCNAVAGPLPSHVHRICRRGRRERHHRHRSLAPLFPDSRRAVGLDGGFALVPYL
jgi:hypothetical protein